MDVSGESANEQRDVMGRDMKQQWPRFIRWVSAEERTHSVYHVRMLCDDVTR